MRHKHIFRYLSLGLISIVLVLSCRKSNPSWNVDVLAPLVKSVLTINNLVPGSILHENPDNSLDIIYSTSLSSFSTHNIFTLPDRLFDTTYKSPLSLTVPGGTIITNTTVQNINSIAGGVKISKGTMLSGRMVLSITSSIKGDLEITFNIPGFTLPSGNTFHATVPIPAGISSASGTYNGVYDLSGYKLDFTGASGLSANNITINYTAMIAASADSVHLAYGDSIRISYAFLDLTPAYAKGYFGDTTSTVSGSTGFPLFRHFTEGTLDFKKIDLGLSVENSIGADVRLTINNLSSLNSRTGNTTSLTHANIGSPINITRSTDNNGNVTPSVYNIGLTATNSNIKPFIENLPDSLKFKLKYEINPLGNISGNNDFGYYDKLLKINFNMRMPLSLIANNLTLTDTLDFKLDNAAGNVNNGNLYLYFDNGFPFSAEVQLYLMDDNLQISDSLISGPNTILVPPLNANSICMGTTQTKLTVPLNTIKMDRLHASKKMYVKVKFNTANQPSYVKIYSTYTMAVKVVGDFNYTVGKR